MKRITEPELMTEKEQTEAYAMANFDIPHGQYIKELRRMFPNLKGIIRALDIGCGTADISIRFALEYPESIIEGFDGSKSMLKKGQETIQKKSLSNRIKIFRAFVTDQSNSCYDVILCNSVLHHLHNPKELWDLVARLSKKSDKLHVFVKDLRRPSTIKEAKQLVKKYSEPSYAQVFKDDFFNSLRASFIPKEVKKQIADAGLSRWLKVKSMGDRHILIYGVIKNEKE